MAERISTKKILIVAATQFETTLLRGWLEAEMLEQLEIQLLHTGVGMINCAFSLGEYVGQFGNPDLAIQIGVAGAFDQSSSLGSAVEVVEECLPELGAESPEGFLTLESLGFPLLQWEGNNLFNSLPNPAPCFPQLPQSRAATVNAVSGTHTGIERIRKDWNPDVESMEGAAFFHAMLKRNIPFAQIRGISNYVEPRNRKAWKLQKAAEAAQGELWSFLQRIDNDS
ncbi:MAG: futalosine hydrolase [Bacteroidia bacterium]|nr:futalosine hydrolase [Bacteroidia bacterium]